MVRRDIFHVFLATKTVYGGPTGVAVWTCDSHARTARSVWTFIGWWDDVIQTKIATDLTPGKRSHGNFVSTPRSTFLQRWVPFVLIDAVTLDIIVDRRDSRSCISYTRSLTGIHRAVRKQEYRWSLQFCFFLMIIIVNFFRIWTDNVKETTFDLRPPSIRKKKQILIHKGLPSDELLL